MQETNIRATYGVRRRLAHRTPFFYGWVMVLGAFLGTFAGGGLQSFTFGVFIPAMSSTLGWSVGALTGALAVRTAFAAMLGPVFGPLVDKYGPRFLMVASAITGGIASILLTQVSEIWQFYVIFALVGIAGAAGIGGVVSQATVSKWFIRLRGRATAFSTMGNTAAGAMLAPFVGFVIAAYGWQAGWIAMSVIFLGLMLPVAFLMVRQPEDVGLLPDGARSDEEVQETYRRRGGRESAYSWRLKEALHTRALWFLTIALIVGGISVSSVVVHEFNYVTSQGFSTGVAATVLSTHAISASLARLLWGFLVERFHVRYCLTALFIGCTVGLGILLIADSAPMLFLFAFVYGINVGGNAVLSNIAWANYFGRDFVGTIRGALNPFTMGAVAAGPVLVGVSFDMTGEYRPAFLVLMVLFIVAAAVAILAVPPKAPVSNPSAPAQSG